MRVAMALGRIKPPGPGVVPAPVARAGDTDPDVRNAAAGAIDALGWTTLPADGLPTEAELLAALKHTETAQRMQDLLRESLSDRDGMTLSAIRELLGTTRKYAVPFCEYLDRIGFTKRKGDVRVLA